jgi:hypothetical protein
MAKFVFIHAHEPFSLADFGDFVLALDGATAMEESIGINFF